jgi:hypothetical protein
MNSQLRVRGDSIDIKRPLNFRLGGFTFVPTLKAICVAKLARMGKLKTVPIMKRIPTWYKGDVFPEDIIQLINNVDDDIVSAYRDKQTKDIWWIVDRLNTLYAALGMNPFIPESDNFQAIVHDLYFNRPRRPFRDSPVNRFWRGSIFDLKIVTPLLPVDHDINTAIDNVFRQIEDIIAVYDGYGSRGYGWISPTYIPIQGHFTFIERNEDLRHKCIFIVSSGLRSFRTLGHDRVVYWWGHPIFMTGLNIRSVPITETLSS